MIDIDEVFGLLINGNVKSYSIAKMVSLLDDKFNVDGEKVVDGMRIPDFTVKVRHKISYLMLEPPSRGPPILPYFTTAYITLSSWRTDDNEFYNTYNKLAGTNFVAQKINRVFFVSGAITMTHVIALAVLAKVNNVPSIYLMSPERRWERAHIEYRVSYDLDVQEPDYLVATMKYTSRVIDSR